MKLALLTAAFALTFACKPAAPARTAATDGDHESVLNALEPALAKGGHSCVRKETGLLCDANAKGKLMFVVVLLDQPVRRVGIVVISKMKVPCSEALPRFNELNRHVDIVTVTCTKEGGFGAIGAMPIPSAGLTGEDVAKFADTWLFTFMTAVNSYALLEVIE